MKVKNRVKSHEDFQTIIHSKQFEKNPYYVIYFKPNELGYGRVGISASNKLGNAVTRVKIRRQVRAMLLGLWDKEIPLDIVIIVRQAYKVDHYNECQEQLGHLLNKILRRIK